MGWSGTGSITHGWAARGGGSTTITVKPGAPGDPHGSEKPEPPEGAYGVGQQTKPNPPQNPHT